MTRLTPNGRVVFGATVHLVAIDDDSQVCYRIVGEDEADITNGLLSIGSPLARALVARQEGDTVEVSTPGGQRSYEIAEVEYI